MPEELKSLIEKIQREGFQAAEEKARAIEDEATVKAEAILARARKEAEKIISDAKKESERAKAAGDAALTQAGRDMLIILKKEISAMLDRVTLAHVNTALKGDLLLETIKELIKAQAESNKKGIVITLKKEDLDKLQKALFAELSGEIKKGVTLKSSDDIQGGFLISYDSGKSYYDFTEKALARYIASSLKPHLSAILNKAV